MTKVEFRAYIAKHTTFSKEEPVFTSEDPLSLNFDEKVLIGEGLFNRVYRVRVEDEYYVVKEGIQEMNLVLTKFLRIPMPRWLFTVIMPNSRSRLTVSHISAVEELDDYATIARYYGFFPYHTHGLATGITEDLIKGQKEIRRQIHDSVFNEDEFGETLLSYIKSFKNYKKIRSILTDDDLLAYNFLPMEYLILGESSEHSKRGWFAKKYKTHYIIQEYAQGIPLSKLSYEDEISSPLVLKRLILFLLLSVYMVHKDKKLIDCKPAEIFKGMFNWFDNTENIIVERKTGDLKLIDTRWLFDKNAGVLEKGIVLTDVIQDSLKQNLVRLVNAYP